MRLLLVWFSLLPWASMALDRTVGSIEMQMRSRSPSDMNQVLLKVMTTTVNFLDEQFAQYYSELNDGKSIFQKMSLSVNSYGMDLTQDGSYIAKASFKGRAFFQQVKGIESPSQKEVVSLTSELFKEYNQKFLDLLVETENPFLEDLSYAVVKVNGVTASSNGNLYTPNSSSGLSNWIYAVIAGVGSFFIVLNVILLCYCCCTRRQRRRSGATVPSKKASTAGTSKGDSSHNDSVSPARSFTSQDSSIFTYNPKSTKSMNSKHTFGSVFTSNTGLEVDVEAWKKKTSVEQAVFGGNDISAISNKKDLSLIEEGSEGEEEPPPRKTKHERKPKAKRGKTSTAYLSEFALSDLERGDRVLVRQPSRAHPSSSRRQTPGNRTMNSMRDLEMSRDVIDDLKDLSHQFDRHRRR